MAMYNSGSQSPTGVANLQISSPGIRKAYDEQTLIPVTISMILNSDSSPTGNGSTTLNDGTNRDLHQVKIVGAIRSIEELNTNTSYQIEDGTGLLEVKYWTADHQSNPANENNESTPQENEYVRIIGQVKNYDDQKHVVAYSFRKLSTGNELTHHMLEVAYSAEREKKKMTKGDINMPVGSKIMSPYGTNLPKANLLSSMNQQFTANGDDSGSSLHNAVLKFFQNEGESDYGANVEKCVQMLEGTFTSKEIHESVKHLLDEALLYSTMGDNYKAM